MKNIFVICAWQRRARANYQKTILNPIPDEVVLSCFHAQKQVKLQQWRDQAGGFFAWGVQGGQRSLTMWKSLEPGDCVLTFFGGHYRAIASLIGTEQSDELADKVWGVPRGAQEGWKHIMFLSPSRQIEIPAGVAMPYLCSTYRGAARIGADRINRIITDFGSIEAFIEKHFAPALIHN